MLTSLNLLSTYHFLTLAFLEVPPSFLTPISLPSLLLPIFPSTSFILQLSFTVLIWSFLAHRFLPYAPLIFSWFHHIYLIALFLISLMSTLPIFLHLLLIVLPVRVYPPATFSFFPPSPSSLLQFSFFTPLNFILLLIVSAFLLSLFVILLKAFASTLPPIFASFKIQSFSFQQLLAFSFFLLLSLLNFISLIFQLLLLLFLVLLLSPSFHFTAPPFFFLRLISFNLPLLFGLLIFISLLIFILTLLIFSPPFHRVPFASESTLLFFSLLLLLFSFFILLLGVVTFTIPLTFSFSLPEAFWVPLGVELLLALFSFFLLTIFSSWLLTFLFPFTPSSYSFSPQVPFLHSHRLF